MRTLEKEKSEMINHFSSRNCFLIKYLCLRWWMAIFHYPFTNLKLSASCPLLSLIISFITLTKDHPPHWRQVQEKSFQNHEQSSADAQKKSTELILLKAETCKHKKSTSNKSKKKKKRKDKMKKETGKNLSWKGSIRNRKRRQKDKSQEKKSFT